MMTTTLLKGYIARETEAAVAFFDDTAPIDAVKPFFIPRKKITRILESDAKAGMCRFANEMANRQAIPCTIEVDTAFLVRVGLA